MKMTQSPVINTEDALIIAELRNDLRVISSKLSVLSKKYPDVSVLHAIWARLYSARSTLLDILNEVREG